MRARLGLLIITLVAAGALLHQRPPLRPPLSPGEELLSRSEREARAFGVRPSAPPVASPLTHSTTPAGRAIARFVAPTLPPPVRIQGSVIDPDTGDVIAWGIDSGGDDVAVIIPRNPADIDPDGWIDASDVVRMIESLGASGPRTPHTDLNGDGATDAHDLDAFWNSFFSSGDPGSIGR